MQSRMQEGGEYSALGLTNLKSQAILQKNPPPSNACGSSASERSAPRVDQAWFRLLGLLHGAGMLPTQFLPQEVNWGV